MILTTLPDLPPRPETAANAEFRRRFYARWGRENAIVCGHARHAEYAEHAQTLSIKMAQHGRERYAVRGHRRDVVLDDDNYLVLNEGARYGSVLRGDKAAYSLAVFFRPGAPGEVATQRVRSLAAALDSPDAAPRRAGLFAEHLRPHGDAASMVLQRIAADLRAGERDEAWLDEQCDLLLEAMLAANGQAPALDPAGHRRAQQRELQRRLHLARDFIESHYTEALTLPAMAAVACLSRYHFVREFARAFGRTPHAYLTDKRARAAARLLAAGVHDADRLAAACGFGSRWSLRRALERQPRNSCTPPAPPQT